HGGDPLTERHFQHGLGRIGARCVATATTPQLLAALHADSGLLVIDCDAVEGRPSDLLYACRDCADRTAPLPVLLLATERSAELAELARSDPAVALLPKPLKPSNAIASLARLLGEGSRSLAPRRQTSD